MEKLRTNTKKPKYTTTKTFTTPVSNPKFTVYNIGKSKKYKEKVTVYVHWSGFVIEWDSVTRT